jgi:hypothetical protein
MDGFAFPMIISGQQRPRSASRPQFARLARRIVRIPLDSSSPPSPYCTRTQNKHRYEQPGNTACHDICSDGATCCLEVRRDP